MLERTRVMRSRSVGVEKKMRVLQAPVSKFEFADGSGVPPAPVGLKHSIQTLPSFLMIEDWMSDSSVSSTCRETAVVLTELMAIS